MHEPDNKRAIDREMAALFAAADAPTEAHAQFVKGVLRRIRWREQVRWLILGSSVLIAIVLAAPILWEFNNFWAGIDLSAIEELRAQLNQIAASATAFVRSAVRSVTFLAAATLAVVIVPLLRWLAD